MKRQKITKIYPLATSMAVLLTACGGGSDDTTSNSNAAATTVSKQATASQVCATLAGKAIGVSQITAADVKAAKGSVPSYCKVAAKLEPSVNFEMSFPDNWNGKLYYSGGGGYNGVVAQADSGNLASALAQGYAVVASDSGHQGNPLDASFALNNPVALRLFGNLSVPNVTSAAIDVIQAAYGAPPEKKYFEGCSNGGREALMTAQRFPNLFDGVIARAPALNWAGQLAGAFNRNAKAFAAPGGQLTPAKITLLAKSVLNACDTKDGVKDGLVSNPSACTSADFNPQVLRCANGADTGDSCLSDAQLNTIKSWTDPIDIGTAPNPVFHNAGWALSGNEDDPGAWPTWLTGANGTPGWQFLFQDTTIKNIIARDPAVNSLTYPLEQNYNRLFSPAAEVDATDPDLTPMKRRGAKLILWHGLSDSALSYKNTNEYYNAVASKVGGQQALSDFVRYYQAPGVNHCSGGPGADQSNLLVALDSWVTKNTAPGTLAAQKVDSSGNTVLSRPLCPYPQYARYVGPANDDNAAKQASNFVCTNP
ncbi:tannase/feruloyl esterase family alpha/beta hydrolase [Spongiibacter sp. KMU-158]|uniref:Tannase/feruloyl esterase family alpha/beta hydrolase n=2 Tax=Spongiibacter pelagi TaxID=2760804 RepID=A0A927GWZ3_9GAMM|nr:tannase/feruloyl esterase family alpha/beta hydrolase [Spongiibacter pelagi]